METVALRTSERTDDATPFAAPEGELRRSARDSVLPPFVLSKPRRGDRDGINARVPTRMPAGAARIVVTEARGASLALARHESTRFVTPVEQCLATAQRADPLAYSRVPLASVVVHLSQTGVATTIDIDPSDLAHGLSQCLATALLPWRHAGHTAPRATLRLLVALSAQPLSQAASAR